LTITELHINKSFLKEKAGNYKSGFYYQEHTNSLNVKEMNVGLYFVGDQQITDKLSVFSQIGLSPREKYKNNRYYSIGINCKGLIAGPPDDRFGTAIAYAGINDKSVGSETAIEMTYKLVINNNIYLKPDIQYIINPAGTAIRLNNALVGFVRFGLEFE